MMSSQAFAGVSRHVEVSEIPDAYAWYQEKAQQGNVDAQFNVGLMRETGWSVPEDAKIAIRWYREAARQGHVNAQIRLGMMYYLGVGARQSKIKGRKWIREAAKQKHVLAVNLYEKILGDDVPHGLNTHSAIQKIRKVYLEGENANSAVSELTRLITSAREQDSREEKKREDSTMRERRAQRLNEGPARSRFEGVNEQERVKSVSPGFLGDASSRESHSLARKSITAIRSQAKNGMANAQYNLGRMYELGIQVSVDKQQARSWYKKAADQSYAQAEYRFGIALLYGDGIDKDKVQGKRWLIKAAEHKHPVAKNMIEGLRSTVGGTDMSMAANWYLEDAVEGDADAAFHLGKLYEHGWGVQIDYPMAIKWYQRASKLGRKDAKTLALALRDHSRIASAMKPENNAVERFVQEQGLPKWLAHPALFVALIVLLLWVIFFRGGNRKKKIEGMND